MRLEQARVLSLEEVYANAYLMWLSCPPVAKGAQPGQFLMIHCTDAADEAACASDDPLLPRPMSYHRFRPSTGSGQALGGERQFAILFDVRGRGTAWLARRRPGDCLCLFGPLGRGFDPSPRARSLLLVAGGLGVAGLAALADQAVADGRAVTLLHGARSAAQLFPARLLPPQVELAVATDDGSAGHQGYVTDLFGQYLPWADQVFACGPNPMFQTMAQVMRQAQSRKSVQVLLEEHMACGTGICYGCAVFPRRSPKATRLGGGGVRLVCKDGPRFELREVF
ncbi:MAG: dihydroorotate dehydrogenase electron transfer subunit [Dehalococcoidia bacterium]